MIAISSNLAQGTIKTLKKISIQIGRFQIQKSTIRTPKIGKNNTMKSMKFSVIGSILANEPTKVAISFYL